LTQGGFVTLSADAYRSIDLSTAPARALVLRAYDAAIRALEEAERELAAGRPGEEALHRAQTIVSGLMSALDFRAGEIAEKLLRLYMFVVDRIRATRADRVDRGLGDCRGVLDSLRAGWAEMEPEAAAPAALPRRGTGFQARG
jgi:flagellar protein FliS